MAHFKRETPHHHGRGSCVGYVAIYILVITNNHVTPKCLGQTWYLAVDMQLFWVSPLILLPLYHNPRAGRHILVLLLVLSCLLPIGFTLSCGFPMANVPLPEQYPPYSKCSFGRLMYAASQCRATPYLFGILLGYHFSRKHKTVIPKWLIALGWLLSTAVSLTVIFSLSVAYQPEYQKNPLGAALYAGLHRVGWSLSIMWIILVCHGGGGGLVDRILSWSGWIPLSRLSFSAYLLHYVVLIGETATKHSAHAFTATSAIHAYLGDLAPVFVLATALHVLVEAPLLRTSKLLLSPSKK